MADPVRKRVFNDGDRVRVVGPLAESYQKQTGTICSVTVLANIHRYSVKFDNGSVGETFFGFELQLMDET